MFNPSRDEVRRFFTETWRKQRAGEILTPLEAIAADWIVEHPEYHAALADVDSASAEHYSPERGETNPFLHLSMHLAISEQLSIDQPPGIRAAHERLAASSARATTPITRSWNASAKRSGKPSAPTRRRTPTRISPVSSAGPQGTNGSKGSKGTKDAVPGRPRPATRT